jgi:hypothetical protein
MSEFKFACPVCGQHMMCDASQAGTVMDCPTCFQKITAPQAPASADQKFILTGTKVEARPAVLPAWQRPNELPAKKNFPFGVIVLLLVVGAASATLFVFRGKIFQNNSAPKPATNEIAKAASPLKPALFVSPANDANWLLTLGTNAIADAPVAGRIHAQDFLIERASLYNGSLTLRTGGHGPVTFGVSINFSGAPAEALAGQTINVLTNAETAARVTLHWQSGAEMSKESFSNGYALRLEFGALANNHLPGKIYLCTPDADKSYLTGNFIADARKPKSKKK